ncbi:MAG: hypothetical protein JNM56_04960 [Planctomycetia bacterium]|nr:hypothetical protein [Planctomycetia bacterium]
MPHTPHRSSFVRSFALVLCAQVAGAGPCLAQGRIERIDPPVAQRGKTTRVTLVGSQLAQAVDLWSSLPAGKLKATPVGPSEPGKATLDVEVTADAPVGPCGLRLATRDGLSNTHLFLIDDLPSQAKTDAASMKVALPVASWGVCREASVERFTIEATAGQRVSFEVVGSRFGKDFDPLVTLRDAAGKLLAEHDNSVGLCFDCRFEHVFTAAGTYQVEVRDARYQAPEHASYVLRMGRFPAARVALPAVVAPGQRSVLQLPEIGAQLAVDIPAEQPHGTFVANLRRPDDQGSTWLPVLATDATLTVATQPCQSLEQATPAVVPGVLCGVLDKPGARDFFRLMLDKGQRIRVRGEARALQSPADLELALLDAKGAEVRRASDPGRDDVNVEFTAPAAGAYGLAVRDLARDGSPAHAYRIEVRGPQPTITVSAEVEGLTIPQNGYQSLPLLVTRSEKFGALKLHLVNAPPGLSLTPDEIPDGETTLLARLSANGDAPLGLHALQIVAQPVAADSGVAAVPVRTMPLIDRRRVNVDLIPYALREDQQRLPAALTDRLAVQITPAAPFTVELTEALVTLGRYQHADIPIVTTRVPGFDAPISFTARGGQLGNKEDIRTRVFAEFPQATADQREVKGSVHSRILSNIGKVRIEVEGSAVHQGRRITLTRSFDLDLRPVFRVSVAPEKLTLPAGGTTKIRLLANRLQGFDGAVAVQINPVQGLELPAKLEIPRGQESIEVEVKVPAETTPRRIQIRARCAANVGAFEEELQAQIGEVEIPKPEPAKK